MSRGAVGPIEALGNPFSGEDEQPVLPTVGTPPCPVNPLMQAVKVDICVDAVISQPVGQPPDCMARDARWTSSQPGSE